MIQIEQTQTLHRICVFVCPDNNFDVNIWYAGSTWHCLVQVWRHRL